MGRGQTQAVGLQGSRDPARKQSPLARIKDRAGPAPGSQLPRGETAHSPKSSRGSECLLCSRCGSVTLLVIRFSWASPRLPWKFMDKGSLTYRQRPAGVVVVEPSVPREASRGLSPSRTVPRALRAPRCTPPLCRTTGSPPATWPPSSTSSCSSPTSTSPATPRRPSPSCRSTLTCSSECAPAPPGPRGRRGRGSPERGGSRGGLGRACQPWTQSSLSCPLVPSCPPVPRAGPPRGHRAPPHLQQCPDSPPVLPPQRLVLRQQ